MFGTHAGAVQLISPLPGSYVKELWSAQLPRVPDSVQHGACSLTPRVGRTGSDSVGWSFEWPPSLHVERLRGVASAVQHLAPTAPQIVQMAHHNIVQATVDFV